MNSAELVLYSLTRVLHVGTAIVVVGGTFFVRFVLFPAAVQSLSDDSHSRLRSVVMGIWKKVVHAGIALFLLTGAINYYRVIVEGTHKGDGLYHALLGTKIIIALVIFFIASALVGRSPAFEGMRRSAPKWLLVNLILAAIIVAASGFLKVRGTPARHAARHTLDARVRAAAAFRIAFPDPQHASFRNESYDQPAMALGTA